MRTAVQYITHKTKRLGREAVRQFVADAGLRVGYANGKDLIVTDREEASAKCRIRVFSGSGEHFGLRRKYLSDSNLILAYVWNADADPEVFLMTPDEALDFLGDRPQQTKSWRHQGYYKWSPATGLPKQRRAEFQQFGSRHGWLRERVRSGSNR